MSKPGSARACRHSMSLFWKQETYTRYEVERTFEEVVDFHGLSYAGLAIGFRMAKAINAE